MRWLLQHKDYPDLCAVREVGPKGLSAALRGVEVALEETCFTLGRFDLEAFSAEPMYLLFAKSLPADSIPTGLHLTKLGTVKERRSLV